MELTHSGGAYGEEVATSRADDNRCQQSTRFYSSGEEWVSGWVDQEGCRVIQYPRGRRGFVPPLLSAMAGLMAHFGFFRRFFPQILSGDSSDASCLGDSSGVHCAEH